MRLPLGVRVALVTSILLAVLVGMVVMRQWPLLTGREVVLATEPVDPRDLLRGDYVVLAYGPSRLSDQEMPLPDLSVGDTVYVPLTGPDGDGTWHAAGVMIEPPIGPLPFLRGTVQQAWEEAQPEDGEPTRCGKPLCRTVTVAYGIESYFVPEDGGRALEDLVREGGRLSVVVALDSRGGAVIAGLVIDGKRVSREGLL